MTAIIASVTASPKAKLHLDLNGRAHCGAGNGRTIPTTQIDLADATADQLCRRCIKAIRAAADSDIRDAMGGGRSQYRHRALGVLQRLREAIRTPDEIRAAAAFRAAYNAAAKPPSAFALIKQAHATTADRYRDEQLTGQLALAA